MLKLLLFLFSFTLSFAARAEDMRIYDADVEIDATAENAAAAREKALSEANRKALYAVTNRISDSSSTAVLDNLNDNQILNFIQEVSVISEKVVDSRYMASLKITINAAVLKAYLTEKNAPVTIMPETHITIIPIYRTSTVSKPLLWEEENLWYDAWRKNELKSGQITITPVPDKRSIKSVLLAEDALQLNGLSLDAVAKATDNSELYVANAVVENDGLDIVLSSPKFGTILSKKYPGQPETAFETAIQDIKTAVIGKIQQKALADNSAINKITLVFQYDTLKSWVELQNTIKTLNEVTKTTIDAVANRHSQVTLEYTGTFDNLRDKFSAHGYTLSDNGNFYKIERK